MCEWLKASWYQLDGYMQTGGMVMWPLAGVSLVMWLLIVERVFIIGRLYRRPMGFKEAREHLACGLLPTEKDQGAAVGQLVTRFLAARSGDSRVDCYILDETVLTLNRSLTDRLAVIGVLAAVAPLLGLLGTVTGMITTFDVLAIFGTGNAKAMAGGISEALITTQTGLLVAIPGLYMKGFLDRRARNLAKRISAAGLYLRRQL
ncbi:MAG: MotA/TolQ/ExbB proton channel family protein [Proteobacteria bacterium]|nr:MotA/TolQ/ExbB proton channel family protein [Pseudomonadota bacterium]